MVSSLSSIDGESDVSIASVSAVASVVVWYEIENPDDVTGKRHYLDYNGIKLLLPNEFEKYSISRYQQMLDSLVTPEQFSAEVNRVEQLQKMEGDLYLFVDKEYGITLTAATTPYAPFAKRDAQELLNRMAYAQKAEGASRGIEVEKILAKFNGTSSFQIFKTQYRFKVKKEPIQWFTSNYIISSNGKTIFLQLTSPFKIEFDPFIKKIVF